MSADPHHTDQLRDGTSPSTDPDPSDTAGLERGGGVQPGDTPPAESGMSGVAHHQDAPGRTAGALPVWIVLGVVTGLVLIGAVLVAVFGV